MFHDKSVRAKYRAAWNKLNGIYMNCAKKILGAPSRTSHDAVLVRLGWLPLDYLLMYRTCIWAFKVKRGLAGPALSGMVADMKADPDGAFKRSRIFAPAEAAITRFMTYDTMNTDIQKVSVHGFKRCLRQCMHRELTANNQRGLILSYVSKVVDDKVLCKGG